MPATVNVNFMTVVHAGSGGMAMAFPDVCKTPAPPAPPIPIPYPNIAQSSDTAEGSTTVKIDGKPIMLKPSSFSMSSGDEAGSLFGVVSNKNKGKAQPANASFDVKVDGKAVFRLVDPMTANGASACNALAPAEVQAPTILPPAIADFCKTMVEKAKDEDAGQAAMNSSGIHPDHHSPIKKVCSELGVVLYVRKTKDSCTKWIGKGCVPKPHVILNGSTIHAGNAFETKTAAFLKELANLKRARGGKDPAIDLENWTHMQHFIESEGMRARGLPTYDEIVQTSPILAVELFRGIIGHPAKSSQFAYPIHGPILGLGMSQMYSDEAGVLKKHYRIVNDSGASYMGKWMTGDYDLFEVLAYGKGCKRVVGPAYEKLRKQLNIAMKWDGIQHGAQVHWVPEQDHGMTDEQRKDLDFSSMPKEVDGILGSYKSAKAAGKQPDKSIAAKEVKIAKGRQMKVIDEDVTAVFGDGAVNLKSRNDLIEALLCKECGE